MEFFVLQMELTEENRLFKNEPLSVQKKEVFYVGQKSTWRPSSQNI